VDKLVANALPKIPQNLVNLCVEALEDHLKKRTAQILKEIDEAKTKALDEIKNAKHGTLSAGPGPETGDRG
jgi:hypothetical protein